MKNIYFLALTFGLTLQGFSQAPGNTCASAVDYSLPTVVSNSTTTGSQTTCGTGNGFAAGSYCTSSLYGDGEDGVYSITVPASGGTYSFALGGTATYKILSLHSACTPTSANCIAGTTTSSGTTGSFSATLTAGTYFLIIDTWPNPTCGNFSITTTLTAIPVPAPANDECGASATLITPGTPITGTTAGADQDGSWPLQPCTNTGEVWYRFTTPATVGCYSFVYDQVTNGCNTISIFEGACPTGSPTDLQGNTSTNNFNDQGSNESELAGMLPNTTYYISVSNDTDANFTFNIRPSTPLAVNDQCSGANGIGTTAQAADNAVAGCEYSFVSGQDGGIQSTDPNNCDRAQDFPCSSATGFGPLAICALTLENISWYKFTAAAAGNVTITFAGIECNNGGGGFQSGLFTGSNCSSLTATGACVAAASGTATYTIPSATAGATYFIAMDGNAGSNCHYNVSGLNVTPLPIELGKFQASLENNNIKLNWNTFSERNNNYFTIEKSKNGTDWEFVAQVKGAGNSSVEKFYSIIDNSPYEGTSYYKLIQTDFDGKTTESSFADVFVKRTEKLELNVYPNPSATGNKAYVTLYNPNIEDITLDVYEINGKLVDRKIITTQEFSTKLEMTHSFNPGVYFIKATNESGEMDTFKWIVE
ncbi:MAG: T9SS type A sorting domain-containing protein [Flavobacteriia bacterium]